MKRLTKVQQKKLEMLRSKVEHTMLEYNEAVHEFEEFREELVSEMVDYRDERSDRWQESDAGVYYNEWVDAWSETIADVAEIITEEYPTEPEGG